MDGSDRYPVRVEARLDEPLSRWLWLVKWLLAIPHYVVLAVLWVAFVVLTVIALVAIVVTERYPRAIFDFNVGVLRWTWRVQYYAYSALGTDRYPPFTLADDPEYPARLAVDYPQRLSRGLALVKWWLLAIPHYLVVGLFVGGGLWITAGEGRFQWAAGGLVGTLVLVAGVVLTVSGKYPRPIYDFVLGMDRWVVRVGVYAGLMTDTYPPFRLDMGGADPTPAAEPVGEEPVPRPIPVAGWTAGRVVSVIVGAVLALGSVGLLTGGASLLWVDRVHRDDDGFITASRTMTTDGYALVSGNIATGALGDDDVAVAQAVFGDLRLRVTPGGSGRPVFVGIGPSDAVARYLADVPHAEVRDFANAPVARGGNARLGVPDDETFWLAATSGPGTQVLTWHVESGEWSVLVANADASPGVNATIEAGVAAPALPLVVGLLLSGGITLLVVGSLLIAIPVHRAGRAAPATTPAGA